MSASEFAEDVIAAVDLHYRTGETGPTPVGLSELDPHFDSFLLHVAGAPA